MSEISSLLECSLCFESFDTSTRLPKMLSCQHTACLDCLTKLVGKRTIIVCPTCRFEYRVPKGAKALPNNLTIMSMMQHMCEKERRRCQARQSNMQVLRRNLLSAVQSINNKMSKLDSVKEMTSSNDGTDQRATMKSIDDCFQRIYLGFENRREVLRSDVDVHFQKENDVALKMSTIEESKRKMVEFCSRVVDTLEGGGNPSEQELTILLRKATDVLTTVDEVDQQIIDVNATLAESNKPIVFSNVMEDSLISQISYLGRIQEQGVHLNDRAPSKDILRDLLNPERNIAIGVKELQLETKLYSEKVKQQNKPNGPDGNRVANHVKKDSLPPSPDKGMSSGDCKSVKTPPPNLNVQLTGKPTNYKWNDEPLTFGMSYFSKLEEGPLDLALIRDGATKELAVTTEFSQTIGVFDEKLFINKQLGDRWYGHVRGLCTDDRGRLACVTDIGDVYLFESNCPSTRVKRIYSAHQGQGAVHSDYATTKCGIAISTKRILFLANDRDGCVDVIRGRNGKLIRKIGKNRCMEPRGIALTSEENVLIADARNHCVWLFEQDGQCVRKYGKQGKGVGELSEPWGVDVDKDGNVVVADTGNHRIQIFDKSGNSLATLGEHGNHSGQFDWPMSVTVTINRKIIVCDSGNYRIQIL